MLIVQVKQHFREIYNQCIIGCLPGDFECLGACARDYDENKNVCPCQSNCPNGCPCPEYQCPAESTTTGMTTTTTTMTLATATTLKTTTTSPGESILILNTWNANNAVITNGNGKEEYPGNDFSFTFGKNTEVYKSCSVTWRGEFFIFGGFDDKKQITKLNGCRLERVGSLSFDHYGGTCAVVNDEDIYLCFDYYSYKTCRKASEPIIGAFKKINPTNYEHKFTRIAASSGTYFF